MSTATTDTTIYAVWTAKPVTTSGTKCRSFVQQRKAFKNNSESLFGLWVRDDMYVVYSYSMRWPLFAWEGGTWYANCDKYSMTTSKHYSQAHPHSDPAPLPLTQKDMLRLIEHGITGVAVGVPSSHEATYEQFRQHKELYSV